MHYYDAENLTELSDLVTDVELAEDDIPPLDFDDDWDDSDIDDEDDWADDDYDDWDSDYADPFFDANF